MNPFSKPLESRIAKSLQRAGYGSAQVEHIGGGRIRLSVSDSERVVVVALVRSVPGVTGIECKSS